MSSHTNSAKRIQIKTEANQINHDLIYQFAETKWN